MEIFSKVGEITGESLTVLGWLFLILLIIIAALSTIEGVRQLILLRKGYTVALFTVLGIVVGTMREGLSFDVVLGGGIMGFIGGLVLVALVKGKEKEPWFDD